MDRILEKLRLKKGCERTMNNTLVKNLIDEVISGNGIKGKCIGYLPKTNDFVVMHDKGGRIAYINISELDDN